MKAQGFRFVPFDARDAEQGVSFIAGDIHEVHACDRTNWKMLYSIARYHRPTGAVLTYTAIDAAGQSVSNSINLGLGE